MADYSFTVADRPNGVHKTAANTTEDTVTVNSSASAARVQVVNRGTGPIYLNLNGAAAVAEADGTIVVPAGLIYELYVGAGSPVVRLVGAAAGSWPYSVQAMPLNAV